MGTKYISLPANSSYTCPAGKDAIIISVLTDSGSTSSFTINGITVNVGMSDVLIMPTTGIGGGSETKASESKIVLTSGMTVVTGVGVVMSIVEIQQEATSSGIRKYLTIPYFNSLKQKDNTPLYSFATALPSYSITEIGGGAGTDGTGLAADCTINDMVYGNNRFVAVMGIGSPSSSTHGAIYSDNGVNWYLAANNFSGPAMRIAYGNGMFIALVQNALSSGNIYQYSTDGVTWNVGSFPVSSYFFGDITYGGGKFVVVTGSRYADQNAWPGYGSSGDTQQSNVILTSTDGLTWTSGTLPVSTVWTGIAYGNGVYVAVGGLWPNASVSFVYTSTDAVNWTSRGNLTDSIKANRVRFLNGKFWVISGQSCYQGYIDTNTRFASSTDGITWTTVAVSANKRFWSDIEYIPSLNRLVAISGGVYYHQSDANGGSNELVYSDDNGVTWSSITLPETQRWMNIRCSGAFNTTIALLGRTVVAKNSGTLTPYYSYNGVSWTNATLTGTRDQWTSVVYGNGVFVALPGRQGRNSTAVAISTDGVNWKLQAMPTSAIWTSLAYGNGTFVAVASNGAGSTVAATSTDGITWVGRTLPSTKRWAHVAYGNGVFVALSYGGTQTSEMGVATSTDGIVWTGRSFGATKYISSLAYGNGIFVALTFNPWTSGSNLAYTSVDGVNWTQRTLPATVQWSSVAYGNGTFVAVSGLPECAAKSNIAATSVDGVTWTQRNMPSQQLWNTVIFGNTGFVAISGGSQYQQESTAAAKSADGVTWTAVTMPGSAAQWRGGAYGNGIFVVMTDRSIVGSPDSAISVDEGATWATSGSLSDGSNRVFDVGNKYFLINRNYIIVSDDLVNSSITSIQMSNISSISFNSILNIFVATQLNSNKIFTSTDGKNWTAVNLPASNNWVDVGINQTTGLMVAIAIGGTAAATSTDGVTWTAVALPASNNWSSIEHNGSIFVAVAYSSNTYATSTDGVTWTTRSVYASVYKILMINGLFILPVLNNNLLYSSTDGINWTQLIMPGIIYKTFQFRDKLIIESTDGVLYHSVDGLIWTAVGNMQSTDLLLKYDSTKNSFSYYNTAFNFLTQN